MVIIDLDSMEDWYSLCKGLKESVPFSTSIMALSSSNRDQESIECLHAGVGNSNSSFSDYCLAKPAGIMDLALSLIRCSNAIIEPKASSSSLRRKGSF